MNGADDEVKDDMNTQRESTTRLRRGIAVVILAVVAGALSSLPLSALEDKPTTSAPAGRVIRVSGAGLTAIMLSAADLDKMPRKTIKAVDHDAPVTFEGWLVGDLLKKAGFTFGQHFRGPRMADYLVATATDGYRVVFALPELDAEFSDRVVLLADRENGKPLSERDGPYRIIVSDEKKHARWVRNLASLTVATAPADKP